MTASRLAAITVVLLAAGAASSDAQGGVIHGRVVRADWPVGIADVDLVLQPSGERARTDDRGVFEFRAVDTLHQVEVIARKLGFTPSIAVVHAQAPASVELTISLAPSAAFLVPVVTLATRDARSVSEVSASAFVADTAVLRRGQTVSLQEVLAMAPGVQAASRYGTDDVSIGIRGSDARPRQAVRGVAVLLDGVPLTEPDGVGRLDLIDLTALRQVEVVRGPVSALVARSPGGAVNVVSRTGRDSPGASLGVRRGAFGLRKYDGRVGGEFAAGRGSAFAAASYTSTDGYRLHSGADIRRAQATLDYVATPGTRIALEATGSELESLLPGSLTQTQFDADPNAAAPAALTFGFGRGDNRFRYGARIEQGAGSGVASAHLFFGGRTLDFPIPGSFVDLNLHRLQGGLRLQTGPIAGLPMTGIAGLDYDDIDATDRRWDNTAAVRGPLLDDGRDAVRNIGAYTQVEWQAFEVVGLTLGARYDRVRYHFESIAPGSIPRQEQSFAQLSPRISAVWSPGSGMSFYASIGRGFEVPSIGELSGSPGLPVRTGLRPKSLWNYEVGARRDLGGTITFEGSVFYADIRGEFVPRSANNLSLTENASRSRNVGLELAVTARATNRIRLAGTYAFLDPRLQQYSTAVLDSSGVAQMVNFAGRILPGEPRHRLTGEVRFFPLRAAEFGARVGWQSVQYVETGDSNAGTWYFRSAPNAPLERTSFRAVQSRTLVHLDAVWRLGALSLLGSVENVLDTRYAANVVANEAFGRFYEAGPSRSVSLGLRLDGWTHARPNP